MSSSRLLISKMTLLLAALCLILMLQSISLAQAGSASIRGIVSDAQARPVAGATVTLTSTEKNLIRTQTTNDSGGYLFSVVPPGVYKIEVEAKGFKKAVFTDLSAMVDTPTNQDIQLEVGDLSEIVSISSGSEAPLNTTDATIGNTFEARRITDLPLNARNVVGLLSLQPGVTRTGYVNGGRSDQSNITLDGVDVNEQQLFAKLAALRQELAVLIEHHAVSVEDELVLPADHIDVGEHDQVVIRTSPQEATTVLALARVEG